VIETLRVWLPAVLLSGSLGQLSLPSFQGSKSSTSLLAGVKVGRVPLCWVADNTVWCHMAGDVPQLWGGNPIDNYMQPLPFTNNTDYSRQPRSRSLGRAGDASHKSQLHFLPGLPTCPAIEQQCHLASITFMLLDVKRHVCPIVHEQDASSHLLSNPDLSVTSQALTHHGITN